MRGSDSPLPAQMATLWMNLGPEGEIAHCTTLRQGVSQRVKTSIHHVRQKLAKE